MTLGTKYLITGLVVLAVGHAVAQKTQKHHYSSDISHRKFTWPKKDQKETLDLLTKLWKQKFKETQAKYADNFEGWKVNPGLMPATVLCIMGEIEDTISPDATSLEADLSAIKLNQKTNLFEACSNYALQEFPYEEVDNDVPKK